jgi:hypothetical protein
MVEENENSCSILHFREELISTVKIRRIIHQIAECKGKTIDLCFDKCCIDMSLFEVVHHYQQTNKDIGSKEFILTFFQCHYFLNEPQFMMNKIRNIRVDFFDNPEKSSTYNTFRSLIETNCQYLHQIDFYQCPPQEIMNSLLTLHKLEIIHFGMNSRTFKLDSPMASQLIVNNPQLEIFRVRVDDNVWKDPNLHYRNLVIDYRHNPHSIPCPNALIPQAIPFPDISSMPPFSVKFNAKWEENNENYNRDVRWIRAVVGMMRWAEELGYLQAMPDVLFQSILPLVSAQCPSWFHNNESKLFDMYDMFNRCKMDVNSGNRMDCD